VLTADASIAALLLPSS